MIIVQSPLRISFLGGGTDFDDFYLNHGGAVLSTTIDKCVYIIVKERFDDMICVNYTKRESAEKVEQLHHELVREAMRMTGVEKGIEITTLADIPSEGTGLGSSSSITVGLLQALYAYQGQTVTARTLAEQACQIEINILGKPIGRQDQYIAAYGNMRFITFGNSGVEVEKVKLPPEDKRRLNDAFLLFYTGITRKSGEILSEQKANINERLETLSEMRGLAFKARDAIVEGAFDEFGEIMHRGWELKRGLASKITNPQIDEIYQAAGKAGAIGGKITGAGGGGFLLLYCPKGKQDEVRGALKGLRELPFHFEPDGSKIIFNYRSTSWGFRLLYWSWKGDEAIRRAQVSKEMSQKVPETIKKYIFEVSATLERLPVDKIAQVVDFLDEARVKAKRVFIFGNGGSAATASHFAADLSKGAICQGKPRVKAFTLTDNIALLSAWANDTSYENIFAEQLENVVEPGDIVIGISGSGDSPNVLNGIKVAKAKGATTIGFIGFDGGKLKELVDIAIIVSSHNMEQVEDTHLLLGHVITTCLREVP